MAIVFDFDGTLAKSTSYHREGWHATLMEMQIEQPLDEILPYEPNLQERFDSYRRIHQGFLIKEPIKNKVCSYFGIQEESLLTKKIMDLKESLTITVILETSSQDALKNLGCNFMPALYMLKDKKFTVGVVSSSRETIINSFLYKCGIIKYLDFVIGEEALTDNMGILHDKPDPYAKTILNQKKFRMDVYIGDNQTIDKTFAQVCGADFVFADYKTDFLEIANKLLII